MRSFWRRTPQKSAFNRIESCLVKCSQELSRIVLSQDKFGFHLNMKEETIDPELEKRNLMPAEI